MTTLTTMRYLMQERLENPRAEIWILDLQPGAHLHEWATSDQTICAHCGHPLDEPEPYRCLRADHPTGLMHDDCHIASGCPCEGDDDGSG